MSIDVESSYDDRVQTWWINRIDARNAINLSMWERLIECAANVHGDHHVRVVVIRGRGDHFSSGADIKGLGRSLAGDHEGSTYRSTNAAAESAVSSLEVPTIAAIDGFCVGGGVQLALACDLRVATEESHFAVTPAKIGIAYPASALTRLVAMVGAAAASDLLLTGETIDAQRALAIGLVSRLCHGLDEAVDELVTVLLARSSFTQTASKRMITTLIDRDDLEALGRSLEQRSLTHGDLSEGLAAFSDKRAAHFGDREAF